MTLLIGTNRGIWADRRVTDCSTGQRFDAIRKLASNKALVAGFAGELNRIMDAIELVRAGETDVEAIAACKVDGIILMRESQRLYTLDVERALLCTEPFVCAGSGWLEAKCFLAGRGDYHPRAVRAAHAYVAKVRIDCGDGVDFASRLRRN